MHSSLMLLWGLITRSRISGKTLMPIIYIHENKPDIEIEEKEMDNVQMLVILALERTESPRPV